MKVSESKSVFSQERAVAIIFYVLQLLLLIALLTVSSYCYYLKQIEEDLSSKNTELTSLNRTLRETIFSLEDENQLLAEEITYQQDYITELVSGYSEEISAKNAEISSINAENEELLKQISDFKSSKVIYRLSNAEIDLLCRVAQSEAGYGNYESQRHVVNVVLNRVASEEFPNTVTEVIYQHSDNLWQFTVAKNSSLNTVAREDTVENVENALLHSNFVLPSSIIYFHATSSKPNCTPYLECEGTTFGY